MADISTTPLVALSSETRFLLSSLLNPIKVFPTCDKIPRDWRGLADLFSIGGEMLPTIATNSDPTGFILEFVINKKPQCTLQEFQRILEQIGRWDVIDDAEMLFQKDVEKYMERMERSKESAEALENGVDNQMLTIDDLYRVKAGLETQMYDAFLLCADDDFTQQTIENLEQKHNLKLCIKDRDLISGITFEHEAIMQLISERCNRLMVVISPNFLKSPENKFFLNYAQAIGIEKRQRKIIPCLYQPCEIPTQLKYTFILDYNKSHLYDFWKRLADSIETVTSDSPFKRNSNEKIQNATTNCTSAKQNCIEQKKEVPEVSSVFNNNMKEEEPTNNVQMHKSKLFSWGPKKRLKQNKSELSVDDQVKNLPTLTGLDSLESTSICVTSPKKEKKKRAIKVYAEKIKSLVGSKS